MNGTVIVITEKLYFELHPKAMIKVIKTGRFCLIQTKKRVKHLILDTKYSCAWTDDPRLGELLVLSKNPLESEQTVAGKYRLYEVISEPQLTNVFHLELLISRGLWQGYLLPSGLPDHDHKRTQIIPTQEQITRSLGN